MNINEQEIRDYLKKLTIVEKTNSVYFKNVDFDKEPIDKIIRKLVSLYEEIQMKKEKINNNFQSTDGYPAPVPITREEIIKDCRKKEEVLVKILYNHDIYNMFKNYKDNEEKKSSSHSK